MNHIYSLTAGALLGALAAGCTTSRYNAADNLKFEKKHIEKLAKLSAAEAKPITHESLKKISLGVVKEPYSNVSALTNYATLPPVWANFYIVGPASVDNIALNTARPGWINSESKSLEYLISNTSDAQKASWTMGSVSRSFVSPVSGANQFTRDSGLYAIDIHSNNENQRTFSVKTYESGKINGSIIYTFEVTFGERGKKEFEILKRRNMLNEIKRTATETAAGAGIGMINGPQSAVAGSIGMLTLNGIEIATGYLEARNKVPEGNNLIKENSYISPFDDKTSNVHDMFSNIRNSGANTSIVFSFGNENRGIIYGRNLSKVERVDEETVRFKTELSGGPNALKGFLYDLGRAFAVAPAALIGPEKEVTKIREAGGVSGDFSIGPGVK